MKTLYRSAKHRDGCTSAAHILGCLALALVAVAPVAAQPIDSPSDPADGFASIPLDLAYIIQGRPQPSTLYFDGSEIMVDSEQRWSMMCNSELTGLTRDNLIAFAHQHIDEMDIGPVMIIDNPNREANIDIVFSLLASVPSEAVAGFATAEAYLETLFADSIQVGVTCSFQAMGSGVIGATGSNYVSNVSFSNSRNGIQFDMDADDVIQSWLPSGTTIPVRWNGNTDTVSNASNIDWTRANYRAAIGTVTGSAGSMAYNSTFNFDYDPSNGVAGATSFVDVVIHETGHALGFVSGADGSSGMTSMDMFRFQRADGDFDYNPDTYEEFQTTPRLVDYNTPDDSHNTDLIDFVHRMSDGSPYQASHFREQWPSWIGLMDPALANGETHYPNYFSAADLRLFDAMGYDYPPDTCDAPDITQQPAASQTVCPGDNVLVSVTVSTVGVEYQWRRGSDELVDDGSHIIGAQTGTLVIADVSAADAADDYNCVITKTLDGCSVTTTMAEIVVSDNLPEIVTQPASQTVTEGDFVFLQVGTDLPLGYTFQWRKGGDDLTDDGVISGSTTDTLIINPIRLSDDGDYDCYVIKTLSGCGAFCDTATITVNPDQQDCPGDLDGSGFVDFDDLNALLAVYGLSLGDPGYNPDADLNGSNTIDFDDLNELLAVYNTSCP